MVDAVVTTICQVFIVIHCHVSLISVIFVGIIQSTVIQITKCPVWKFSKCLIWNLFIAPRLKQGIHCAMFELALTIHILFVFGRII